MQFTQPVPLKYGVASGHGTVEFDGWAKLGFEVIVLFRAEGAVPFGVSTGGGIAWH